MRNFNLASDVSRRAIGRSTFMIVGLWAGLSASTAMMGAASASGLPDRDVTIGVLVDMSGPLSNESGPGSVAAAELAVEDYGGEVAGRKIRILSADHQNKTDIAATIAREWVDERNLDAFVDVASNAAVFAVKAIAEERNKAAIVSSAGSADLTGKDCSPTLIHWAYDSWSMGNSLGTALTKPGDKWFLITVDHSFGHSMEEPARAAIATQGGEIAGSVRHPFGSPDMASYILQAQASGANKIGLLNSVPDLTNAVKQGQEFGLQDQGKEMVGFLTTLGFSHSVGTEVAQGMILADTFYWDQNEASREFSQRFAEKVGRMPNSIQAGVYSSVLHFLKSVESIQSLDGREVVKEMKRLPTDDPLFGQGKVLENGRKIHPITLYRIKTPGESTGEWDLYVPLQVIPAEQAFRPIEEAGCPLVQ